MFKLAVSAAFLCFLLRKVDWQALSPESLSPGDLAAILVMLAVQIALGCAGFLALSTAVSDIHPLKVARIYLWGVVAGMFTLGVVGELVTIPLLKKDGLPLPRAVSLPVADKILSLFIYLLFTISAFFILWRQYFLKILVFSAIFTAISLILIYIRAIRKAVKKYLFDRYMPAFTDTVQTFVNFFLHHKKKVFIKLLMSLLRVLLNGLIILYAVRVMEGNGGVLRFLSGLDVRSYIHVTSVTTAAHLITFIPVSLNGLGILEFSSTYALALLGFDKNNVIISLLLVRVLLWCLGFFLFTALIYIWKNKTKDVQRHAEA